ncbi:MAG: hypothetical protein AB7E47_12305 [Desulfovibrionaceae bacterium]
MKKGDVLTVCFACIVVQVMTGVLLLCFNANVVLASDSFHDIMRRVSNSRIYETTSYIEVGVPDDQNAAMFLADIMHLTAPLTDDETIALRRARSNATVSDVDVETLSYFLKRNNKFINEARRSFRMTTYFDGALFHPEKPTEPSPQKTLAVLLPCFEASSLLGLGIMPVDVHGALDLLELADLMSKTPASISDYMVYYFSMKKWAACARGMLRAGIKIRKDDILAMLRHVESIHQPSNVYATTLSAQMRLSKKLYDMAIIGNSSFIGNNQEAKKAMEDGLVEMALFISHMQDWLHANFKKISNQYITQRANIMSAKDKYILAHAAIVSPMLEETLSLETEIGCLKTALCRIAVSSDGVSNSSESTPMCPGTAYRTNRMTGMPFQYLRISPSRFMVDTTPFTVPEVME